MQSRGNGRQSREIPALLHSFPAREEEQLVFLDGSAESTAIHILDVLGHSGGRKIEKVLGAESAVGMVLKSDSVKVVGPGFGLHGDGRASGQPLLRIEVVGRNIHGLNRFLRRHVQRMMRQPRQHRGGAVQAGVVAVPGCPVHVRSQGSRRRIRHRILKVGRCRARNQVNETLVVPVLVQREIRDFLRAQFLVHIRPVGLEGCSLRRDCYRFCEISHLQRRVHTSDVIQGHLNAGLSKFLEAGQSDL